jgi:hypothetical protein
VLIILIVWTKNGSTLPNEKSNIVKVKDTGQNTYGLTVTTSVGCTDTNKSPSQAQPQPQLLSN